MRPSGVIRLILLAMVSQKARWPSAWTQIVAGEYNSVFLAMVESEARSRRNLIN